MKDLVEKSHVKMGRNTLPSYSLIDSQSFTTTDKAEDKGIDGGKKDKVHKRHIVPYTQGHLLLVQVHAALMLTCCCWVSWFLRQLFKNNLF